MSTRWMAVQYVGDTLRIPVANESDMDKPFGSSRLERDIKRIVVNPFSDSPQTFVPEAENANLRELVARMAEALGIDCEWADPNWCKSPCVLEFGCWPNDEHAEIRCPVWAAMQELGIEVTE